MPQDLYKKRICNLVLFSVFKVRGFRIQSKYNTYIYSIYIEI